MVDTLAHDGAGTARGPIGRDPIDGVAHEASGRRPEAPARERRGARAERRRYTLETLRRSAVGPRRTSARRRADRRYPVLDRFDAGMLALAVLLVGFSVLDSLFTLMLLARGGSELNPIMEHMLGYGVGAFAAVKMTLTAVPAVLLVATGNLPVLGRACKGACEGACKGGRARFRVRSALAALVGLYAGLIVYELALLSLG